MDKNAYRFPTLGELMNAFVKASGLMARKNSKSKVFDESQKKAMQMKLKRLADETSKLDDQLEDVKTILAELLYEVIPEPRFIYAIIASIDDVLVQYKDLIRNEGTYSHYLDSIRWMIYSRGIERIITSIVKNGLSYNLLKINLIFPSDIDWWLPTFEGEKIDWPIKKAWQWIYDYVGLSQRQFHLSSKPNFKEERNLENAQRWVTDKQFPSTNAMIDCLDDALIEINTKNSISNSEIISFKIIIFLSRVSTYAFKLLNDTYGYIFSECISRCLLEQFSTLKEEIGYIFLACGSINYNYKDIVKRDALIFDYVSFYWSERSRKLLESIRLYDDKIKEVFKGKKEVKHAFDSSNISKHIPLFEINALIRNHEDRFNFKPSMIYVKLLLEGLKLKRKPKSIDEIIKYENNVNLNGFKNVLAWVVQWSYANYFYNKNDYNKSYFYYKKAFYLSKYSVGHDQYLLVNQYIEICAKNKKYREFKKGLAWAKYLNIPIRWLRNMDNPESEENVKFLYSWFMICNYCKF
ncbi:hypothetical protein [Celerinatantimonas sp. YJH-8]|uniref:hypothetical protein n=1 Tax=Celerinatantimonas sp. YJH-8 TaxID=3228714 RepID=UPI0038C617B2